LERRYVKNVDKQEVFNLPRRALKGNSNRTIAITVSEEIHTALVDLAYKKNATFKTLVTEAIIEMIKCSK
jgi:hypothetical protein